MNFLTWDLWFLFPSFFLPFLLFFADANKSEHAPNYHVCARPGWPGEGWCALRVCLPLTGWTWSTCLWIGGCFGNCLPNCSVLCIRTIIFQAGLFVVIVIVCQAQSWLSRSSAVIRVVDNWERIGDGLPRLCALCGRGVPVALPSWSEAKFLPCDTEAPPGPGWLLSVWRINEAVYLGLLLGLPDRLSIT